jgi:hypothetical protein
MKRKDYFLIAQADILMAIGLYNLQAHASAGFQYLDPFSFTDIATDVDPNRTDGT